ncbi:MAG TPA: hypothetical protein VF071_12005 [Candidatus Limnocylindria bacterium]
MTNLEALQAGTFRGVEAVVDVLQRMRPGTPSRSSRGQTIPVDQKAFDDFTSD